MNQIVDAATIVSAVPILMTRKEKLLHRAKLIRERPYDLGLYHRLEHYSPTELQDAKIDATHSTAFGVALSDPQFCEQGLGKTGYAAMNFFELSQQQLHEFSCDCGGPINNDEMANRIERLV